jgi:hypothetical protein
MVCGQGPMLYIFYGRMLRVFVKSQSVLSLASLPSLVYCLWPRAYNRVEHKKGS